MHRQPCHVIGTPTRCNPVQPRLQPCVVEVAAPRIQARRTAPRRCSTGSSPPGAAACILCSTRRAASKPTRPSSATRAVLAAAQLAHSSGRPSELKSRVTAAWATQCRPGASPRPPRGPIPLPSGLPPLPPRAGLRACYGRARQGRSSQGKSAPFTPRLQAAAPPLQAASRAPQAAAPCTSGGSPVHLRWARAARPTCSGC